MATLAGSHIGALGEMVGVNKWNGRGSMLVPTKLAHKRDTSASVEALGVDEMEAEEATSHRGEQVASRSAPMPEATPTQEALVVAGDDDDQPSHGDSLAKWRLLQKSERKYQDSRCNSLRSFYFSARDLFRSNAY